MNINIEAESRKVKETAERNNKAEASRCQSAAAAREAHVSFPGVKLIYCCFKSQTAERRAAFRRQIKVSPTIA